MDGMGSRITHVPTCGGRTTTRTWRSSSMLEHLVATALNEKWDSLILGKPDVREVSAEVLFQHKV